MQRAGTRCSIEGDKMKEIITFSFLVPNQPESTSKRSLSEFLQKVLAAGIKLQAISASVDRRRIKIYCAPQDPAKLRVFLKSVKINARGRVAFFFEYKDMRSCLSAFDKVAISAFDFRAFNATVIDRKAHGFMWSDKPFQ